MIRQLIAAILACLAFGAFAAVDANQATQAELETVKGIGPGLSTKIVEARKTGAFKNWADLVDRVSGIGEGNAARFSQHGLTVAGSAYTPAPKTEKADKPEKAAKGEKAPKPARKAS